MTSIDPQMKHRIRWQRWRNIVDQITSHPGYKYGDPRTKVLLKLARFASQEMAHENTAVHGYQSTFDWMRWNQRNFNNA